MQQQKQRQRQQQPTHLDVGGVLQHGLPGRQLGLGHGEVSLQGALSSDTGHLPLVLHLSPQSGVKGQGSGLLPHPHFKRLNDPSIKNHLLLLLLLLLLAEVGIRIRFVRLGLLRYDVLSVLVDTAAVDRDFRKHSAAFMIVIAQ